MTDKVYIFNKYDPYMGHELGEIQTGFNMSFVIDGNKDSTKLIVRSFSGDEVEPYTILLHENTNTWWCVSNDKVERYTNESGYVYIHNLTLCGAKELLNARDLTDCGFNQKRYTIDAFIKRLFKLSKFEFTSLTINYGNNLYAYDYVKYIKNFENYTLLSALREFLDAYNCDFKLTFTQTTMYIVGATLTIIPKTGNVDLDILNANNFSDVREIKKIDKNSFGTTVVSNAENVISSVLKTYPSVGSARLSATEYEITNETAVLRLPSKVYKAKVLTMCYPCWVAIEGFNSKWKVFGYSKSNVNAQIDDMISYIELQDPSDKDELIQALEDNRDYIAEQLALICSMSLYDGNKIDPTYRSGNETIGKVIKGDNVPYIPTIYSRDLNKTIQLLFCDKEMRNCLPTKEQGFYWERGSNLIQGFDIVGNQNNNYIAIRDLANTNYRNSSEEIITLKENRLLAVTRPAVPIGSSSDIIEMNLTDLSFVITYLPMSDLKIDIDNKRDSLDIQLYNQNGKLTDSIALSKLLNSYSREISSDNITRYMDYYGFNNCPKVGQMVTYNNELYVINNLSLDLFPNENDSYFINAEINMCKYVSTKSLMVNPNTNIRDYGIPQNFNVKRKQLYRDYLEFDYTQDTNATGSFYNLNIPFNITTLPNNNATSRNGYQQVNHTAIIHCKYENAIGGNGDDVQPSTNWYYQLESIVYQLDKMRIEVIDFNDNNIIGYGSQNTTSAFQVSKIFNGYLKTVNTPISYVDDIGEVKGISLKYVTNEQLNNIWYEYQNSEGYSGNNGYNLTNYSVVVPQYIFVNLVNSEYVREYDMFIEEDNYYKDATEVPVFEYVFQVGDSDNVLISDTILSNYRGSWEQENEMTGDLDIVWLYSYAKKDANTLNLTNALQYGEALEQGESLSTLDNAIVIDEYSNAIDINLYSDLTVASLSYGGVSYGLRANPEANKDYAIYRIKYSTKLNIQIDSPELVMVLKNVPSSAIVTIGSEKRIRLYKNKYKLK